LGPGRHFLCRMNFSNVFVDFSTGFWTNPLPLFQLLCFFSFSPLWVHQWRHKAIANTSKYGRWKNFSYNIFLVDVTLAVCKLSQKSCRNVNISASAVPKGFLARVKRPIISVEPPLHKMFFSIAKFLAHTSNKLKQVKAFTQCSLLAMFTQRRKKNSVADFIHAMFTQRRKKKQCRWLHAVFHLLQEKSRKLAHRLTKFKSVISCSVFHYPEG